MYSVNTENLGITIYNFFDLYWKFATDKRKNECNFLRLLIMGLRGC